MHSMYRLLVGFLAFQGLLIMLLAWHLPSAGSLLRLTATFAVLGGGGLLWYGRREITQAEKARRAAEEELRLAAAFFEITSEAITVTDSANRIIAVNPAFSRITGYSEAEVLGRDPAILNSGRHDSAFYRAMWESLYQMGRWQGEVWNRRKSGELYAEWISIVALKDATGEVIRHLAVFSDITKRKYDEQKIWRQANFDALTDLPNRTLFLDRLNQALRTARREGWSAALLFIDLDRFKSINDTLGHFAGDQLLQQAAARLAERVRDSDTVARLGGDEFGVILSDLEGDHEAEFIAEKIIASLTEPFSVEGYDSYISASVGIALYPRDGDNMESLLRNAEAAMHQAKATGRNAFRYYTQQMNEQAERRLKLEAELRRAVEAQALEIHYQPILLSDGQLVGAEALLRWRHPEFGEVSPEEFVPLAEEIGLIIQLDRWVLAEACREAVRWSGFGGEALFVSVNISTLQCTSNGCISSLESVLAESGLAPSRLKLEITEGSLMENTGHVMDLLRQVKALGVELAVDDFGTGYSSLSYLKRFPVDVLKIDREFVIGLPDNPEDAALVEAMIAMAHSLNLKVITEGVESPQQLAFLKALHADLIQGYYFSRPLSAEGFRDYLGDHASAA